MKRILCGALAAAMMVPMAMAYHVPHENETGNIITHTDANCDPEAQAEMLKKLGLFMGTDKGFELDRAMTRAEGAAMLCRFLGGAEEASKGGFSHPFQDVPAWADNVVGWLYQKKLTYGVSDTAYGSSQPLTADQFCAFLSRALNGNDDFKETFLTTEERQALEGKPFLRSYAVAMSVRALDRYGEQIGDGTFAQWLVDQGVFTAEAFGEAAWDVLRPWFNGTHGTYASVNYAKCEPGDLVEVTGCWESTLPYLYATRKAGSEKEYYRVSWKTMETVLLGKTNFPGENGYAELLGSAGGRDYLLQVRYMEDDSNLYSVYSSDGTDWKLELSEDVVGAGNPEKVESPDSVVLQLADGTTVRLQGGDAVRLEQPETQGEGETTVLCTGENAYVMQTVTEQGTTVSSIEQATGKVLNTYTVEKDIDNRELSAQETDGEYQLLFGSAGMYHFNLKTGELVQVLDTLVNDVTPRKASGTVYYLTNKPGKRIAGMNKLGGDTIIRIDHATGERTTLLEETAEIPISGFTGLSSNALEFHTASDVGMQHFTQYRYSFDLSSGKVTVTDFEAGRPEVENGFDYEHPEAYKKAYIEGEQARLDEVWNSKR